MFSLRADGFAWADCAVVFEELGRYCVPGPARAVAAARRRPDRRRRRARTAGVGRAPRRARRAVVRRRRRTVRSTLADVDAASRRPGRSTRCTPVARVITRCPRGDTDRRSTAAELAAARRGAHRGAASGWPTGCTELAVEYAKEREQFDRPIGSFQAIKHLCADMVVRTEVARAAVYARGRAPRRVPRPSPGSTARSAAPSCSRARPRSRTARPRTQVFGGMGFTWEVDVHLYLKRAWVLDTHFGSADAHADARRVPALA